jgi:uncharacterized protein
VVKASHPALHSFLADPSGPNLPSPDEVCGFIFAVAGAPDLVPPSEWLPEAFGGEMPEFENIDQAQAVMNELMEVYNGAVAGGFKAKRQAPRLLREPLANLDEEAAAARWSRGFHRGYGWMSEAWQESLPDELEPELASILLVLTFFSSMRMAELCLEETGRGKSLEEVAEIMRRTFKDAMADYVHLGQSFYQAQLEGMPTTAPRRRTTGRNEPCVCGSGRKYKKCCGSAGSTPAT